MLWWSSILLVLDRSIQDVFDLGVSRGGSMGGIFLLINRKGQIDILFLIIVV